MLHDAPAAYTVDVHDGEVDVFAGGGQAHEFAVVVAPIVADGGNRVAFGDHEVELVTAVGKSGLWVFLDQWFENRRLGDDTPVREGRRMRWLDQVLAPLQHRLPPAELRRLQAALALTLSIEPITIMHDVCHIDDDAEILDILRWAAHAMLHTALDASPGAETD